MKLEVFETVSLPDPDGGEKTRNFKIGKTFDSDELTDEKLALYLERGIVGIVGGKPKPEEQEPEPAVNPKPEPAPEPKPAKAAKKATSRRAKKAGRK